jgi:hypothetical protein
LSEDLLSDYFDKGMSLDILSSKYGVSQDTIRKRVKSSGRVRDARSHDRRSSAHTEPLSPLHKHIGIHFLRWRTVAGYQGMSDVAKALGISVNRLHQIEGGIHNWTLLELHYLCERMGWNLKELLND